jgi:hypothetical protein
LARFFDTVTVAVMVLLAVAYAALIWLTVPALAPLPDVVIPLTCVPTLILRFVGRRVSKGFSRHDDPGPSVLARRPRILYWIVAATLAAFVILALIAAILQPDQDTPAGQPEVIGGHYFLEVHGDLLPVTKLAYEHGLRITDMSFIAVSMLFNLANLFNLAGTAKSASPGRPPMPRF